MITNPVWAVVIVSANEEWKTVACRYADRPQQPTPFGTSHEMNVDGQRVLLMHGGWGKTAAAASTQYSISRWQPRLVVNLGTCGGLRGRIEQGEILLVDETWIYDVVERMGDAQEALEHYHVRLDLSWLREPYPFSVRRAALLSADQDIDPARVSALMSRFNGVAADWESGAIAWVAQRNQTPCLILRAVTDLVDDHDGEAYGRWDVFASNTRLVMQRLLDHLDAWLACSRL
ncbi:MAG: 5'-methylthioadenosine/S-adenosylhomocysteine nucleosidase [Chloroflexota bacterium]|jgi:adenosylhomocysteine nucleosidase